jgi:hypothetical protein
MSSDGAMRRPPIAASRRTLGRVKIDVIAVLLDGVGLASKSPALSGVCRSTNITPLRIAIGQPVNEHFRAKGA